MLFETFDVFIDGKILANFELIFGNVLKVSFLVDGQEFKLKVGMTNMRFMLDCNFQKAIDNFVLWNFAESKGNLLIKDFD